MMAKAWFSLSLAILCSARATLGEPVAPFNTQDLVRLIDQNHINSIDTLISFLPEDFRYNVTLVADSNSLQPSTPLSPRAILWSERGRMALSLNGSLKSAGYNSIEILQAEGNGETIHLYEIKFPLAKSSAVDSISEPQRCLACHGIVARPIWQEYPTWTRSFGNRNDFSTGERQEQFNQFQSASVNNPRFADLFPTHDHPLWHSNFPYREDSIDHAGRFSTGFAQRPNLRLGAFLSRLNAHRIFAQLQKSPDFPPLQDFLISQLMNCKNEKEDSSTLALLQHFGLRKADFDFRTTYGELANDALDFRLSYFDGIATSIEYVVAELLGDRAVPRTLRQKYSTETPRNLMDWPLFDVLDDLGKWLPLPFEPSDLTNEVQKREPFNANFQSQFRRVCAQLKPQAPNWPLVYQPLSTPKSAGEQIIRNKCSECHSQVGLERLAFSDPAILKEILKQQGQLFIDKVAARTASTDPERRMPFHREQLTETERAALLDYLKKVTLF